MEQLVHIDDVKVPEDRQRSSIDPRGVEELADSIKEHGLINPITLENDGKILRAGERRYRALKILHERGVGILFNDQTLLPGLIPFTRLHEITPRQRKEIEFEENFRREDLSWQDEARVQAELHKLRLEEHGQWSAKDTAEEIAQKRGVPSTSHQQDSVRVNLRVADFLHDPEVAAAKDAKSAEKIARKKLEKEFIELLASMSNEDPEVLEHFHNDLMQHFICSLPDGLLDVIVTDPPYGINAQSFGDQATTAHEYSDTPEEYQELMPFFACESYRVSADQAHLYMFCDIRWFDWLEGVFEGEGWDVWHRPLIWNKLGRGMLPDPDRGPRNTYECILYANKGGRPVLRTDSDVISCEPPKDKLHATQKPLALYRNLLNRSALQGDKVGDFFAGSGTILHAARELSLTPYACEVSAEHYATARASILTQEGQDE